jgi:hypothetical protein
MNKELKKAQKDFERTIEELEKKSYSVLKITAIEYNAYCTDVRQELMRKPMSFDDWYEQWVLNLSE